MTLEIAVVLLILAGAVALFVTEWLRMDLVALLVLVAVALTGYVTPTDALSGFSSPAVVTVWAMFIISGGLTATGVADRVGQRLVRVAGDGETRLIAVVMLAAGVLSTVILSNVAVAAMMLPVVVEISRRTGQPPSLLLLPMALGSLLGGMTTMIGTPPSILVAGAIRDFGLPPVGLFAITPIGVIALLAATGFMVIFGRRLLPRRDPGERHDPTALFDLGGRLVSVPIPPDSRLVGMTFQSSRLGSTLGLTVVAIARSGAVMAAPGRDTVLRAGDRLLGLGRPEFIDDVRRVVLAGSAEADVMPRALTLVEARVTEGSPLVGSTLLQSGARRQYDLDVLAVRRDESVRMGDISRWRFLAGDILLLASKEKTPTVPDESGLEVLGPLADPGTDEFYNLPTNLMTLEVPEDSSLAGRTLGDSRVRDRLGLAVWEIHRNAEVIPIPGPDTTVEAGDVLLAQATTSHLELLDALGRLDVDHASTPLTALESTDIGLGELVLSPQTTLEGKTVRELEFRDRYGITVLAIWRQGKAHRTGLRDMALRFGDAILVHGPRERLRQLAFDSDFILTSQPAAPPARRNRAPVAAGILVGVVVTVVVGWLPISVAAVAGASLMVLTRCLTMEDAYRHVEWQAVFLIAGMIPLGIAMDQTGAAAFLARGVVEAVGPMGPLAVLAAIFLMTSLATQVIPTAALVVLMAPIAYTTAIDLGASPLPFLMALAVAASASFSSPVSHPANTLVMGPGGYRFVDYLKVGLPLTGIVFAITMVMVPLIWPF
ncbi:MAG: SLC13 family permease [Acidimicrobiia bacterium]